MASALAYLSAAMRLPFPSILAMIPFDASVPFSRFSHAASSAPAKGSQRKAFWHIRLDF